MVFFTSITLNYLPKARILAQSLKKYCPKDVFYLVLSDEIPDYITIEPELFDGVLKIEDLQLPVENLSFWIFQHTVVELCTAVKGQAALRLLEITGQDKIVYLDPDIAVFNDLKPIEKWLDEYDVLLTPHIATPEKEKKAIIHNELCFLQHGIYNFGFFAVRNNLRGLNFLNWWRDRLLDYCFDDIANGLFTDQKWGDIVPAIFEGVYIIKNPEYNVSTWNLSNRMVTKNRNGHYLVNGNPLQFYHFSGFDSGAQEKMLEIYGKTKEVWELREWYITSEKSYGQDFLGNVPCVYNTYTNGEKITKKQRELLREREDLKAYFGETNPFHVYQNEKCYKTWFDKEYDNQKSYDEKEDEIRLLKKQITDMESSKSWKITAPLRTIRKMILKRMRRRKN